MNILTRRKSFTSFDFKSIIETHRNYENFNYFDLYLSTKSETSLSDNHTNLFLKATEDLKKRSRFKSSLSRKIHLNDFVILFNAESKILRLSDGVIYSEFDISNNFSVKAGYMKSGKGPGFYAIYLYLSNDITLFLELIQQSDQRNELIENTLRQIVDDEKFCLDFMGYEC